MCAKFFTQCLAHIKFYPCSGHPELIIKPVCITGDQGRTRWEEAASGENFWTGQALGLGGALRGGF